MNIDWNELNAGVSSELEKSAVNWSGLAAPLIRAGEKLAPKITPKAVGLGVGGLAAAGGINQAGKAISSGVDNLAQGAMNFAPLLMGGAKPGTGTGLATAAIPKPKPTSILNVAPGEVHSLAEKQFAIGKSASDMITDSISRVLQQRLGSNIIDSVYPKQKAEVAPPAKEKELEITSKYPEMAKLLEDEQNKAYLAKLLSEQG